MGAFEHIILLLSFVYALAITHLLSCVAGFIRAGRRLRFSWFHAFWMVNALVVIITNWISFWDLRLLPSWSVGTIFFTFLLAFVNYLQAALVCPEHQSEGTIDLRAFHAQQGQRYIGAFAALCAVAVVGNFIYGSTYNVAEWSAQNLAVIPMLAVALVATIVRRRWVDIAAPIALAAIWVFIFVELQGALH